MCHLNCHRCTWPIVGYKIIASIEQGRQVVEHANKTVTRRIGECMETYTHTVHDMLFKNQQMVYTVTMVSSFFPIPNMG